MYKSHNKLISFTIPYEDVSADIVNSAFRNVTSQLIQLPSIDSSQTRYLHTHIHSV